MSGSTENGILTRNTASEATVESALLFDGSTLTITKDTDAAYIPLVLRNESDSADTTGSVGIRFDLENTGGTNAQSGQILVRKNQAFTGVSTTIDSTMGFYTVNNGTGLVERMTLDNLGNLAITGTITCATSLTIGSAVMSETDLEKLDDITDGTAAANKAVVLDVNKDVT